MEYDSVTNIMNVTLSPSSSKPKMPVLSYPVDLSPIVEENTYVEISASAGLLASSHYLLVWSLKINGKAKSLDFDLFPSVPGTKKKNASLIVGLSVLAVVFTLSSILFAVSRGYLALEFPRTGRDTKRSDVFSFGALLLVGVGQLNPRKDQRS
ncbi:unnamed protein product [Fraxinus pennsylvanica]|uniref:Legume lectin domain-containing protein n=1 Tax=Fraxinus pennsylvanica TaxID=56036 RepID=A0AAD1Z204_9LAMI|nr:unnamed protein product [Fraxinus pennsylvanica]CAI9761423.1 unnamed protein product [Fraxinus pennsylvanica]